MGHERESSIFKAADEGDVERVKILIEQKIDLSRGDEQQRTALHYATMRPLLCSPLLKEQKNHIAELLIQTASQSLMQQDEAGNTPIHLMALSGLDSLLAEAISLNKKSALVENKAGAYPIHLAIANQEIAVVKLLLTIPEMPLLVDRHEQNLMHHAAKFNNTVVLNHLENTTMDITEAMNARDEDFQTPEDIARHFDFQEVIEWFNAHRTSCSPK